MDQPRHPYIQRLGSFTYGLQDCIPSITLHDYPKSEVSELQNQMPCLERVTGTVKIHEVQYKATNEELSSTAKDVSCGKGPHITLGSNLVKQPQYTDSSLDYSDNENVTEGIF